MITVQSIMRCVALSGVSLALAMGGVLIAQNRDKGPWWPSPHGAKDQAGNSNYITPDKILKALRIPKTGAGWSPQGLASKLQTLVDAPGHLESRNRRMTNDWIAALRG